MADQFPEISDALRDFIAAQHIFFVGSATGDSRINVTPRSTEHLRITGPNEAVFLDLTGSSNETAAHMLADGRMTLLLCAMAGPPKILRLYGTGRFVTRDSEEFEQLFQTHFAEMHDGVVPVASRQIFIQTIDLVQTSCGYGVPLFDFKAERPSLKNWAKDKTEDDIRDYWRRKGVTSMDGLPTGVFGDAP